VCEYESHILNIDAPKPLVVREERSVGPPFSESKGKRAHFNVNDQMSLSIGTPHISVMLSSTTALDAYSISLSL